MNASIDLAQPRSEHLQHAQSTGKGVRRRLLRFVGHFVEMTVAMGIGMAFGDALGIARVSGVEVRAGLWLIAMVVPMAAWMRTRGMSWQCAAEMSGAMALPILIALPLFWADLITAKAAIGIEHMAMAPAMLAAMVLRRHHYGW